MDDRMTPRLKAVILAVGSEMLTSTRHDTNSLFITDVLNELGLDVAYKAVVGDNLAELRAQIAHALSRHRVLILTGGYPPATTHEVVAAPRPAAEDPAPELRALGARAPGERRGRRGGRRRCSTTRGAVPPA
jgi:nicotinamide-nucleotide amidase